jgi:hypothetical protein
LATREYKTGDLETFENGGLWHQDADFDIQDIHERLERVKPSRRAEVTAVSYEESESLEGSGVHRIHGEFYENISRKKVNRVDIITHFWGVHHYTSRPDLALRKDLQLLKSDGAIYVYLGRTAGYSSDRVEETFTLQHTTITTAPGMHLNLLSWLRTIPGLNVEVLRTDTGNALHWALKITVTPGVRITIPEVRLVEVNDTHRPPARVFTTIH